MFLELLKDGTYCIRLIVEFAWSILGQFLLFFFIIVVALFLLVIVPKC